MSTTNHYRIAIIGPTDMVSGFKALGVEAFDAAGPEEVLAYLRTIKQGNNDPEHPTHVRHCLCDRRCYPRCRSNRVREGGRGRAASGGSTTWADGIKWGGGRETADACSESRWFRHNLI